MRAAGTVIIVALVIAGCGADRTPETAATPTGSPTPTVGQPTALPLPDATTADAPTPTPTPRVVDLPVTPSNAAIECSRSGLVAAALDACLQYEGAGCSLDDDSTACVRARDTLEGVLGTRIFPSDCDGLTTAEAAEAPPPWCPPG